MKAWKNGLTEETALLLEQEFKRGTPSDDIANRYGFTEQQILARRQIWSASWLKAGGLIALLVMAIIALIVLYVVFQGWVLRTFF